MRKYFVYFVWVVHFEKCAAIIFFNFEAYFEKKSNFKPLFKKPSNTHFEVFFGNDDELEDDDDLEDK